MENTYTMIALDGAQYGPVSLEQMKAWINDQRVAPDTKIMRSDTKSWLRASEYAELGLAGAPAPAASNPGVIAPPSAPVRQFDPLAERRIRSGARWFFWIAAFSLINTFTYKSGGHTVFVIGLGVTQIIDGFAGNANSPANVAMAIDVIIACFFALLGFFAMKRQSWSFVIGMILYSLDGLIFLATSFWVGLAFHVFVVYWMFVAWKSLNASRRQGF